MRDPVQQRAILRDVSAQTAPPIPERVLRRGDYIWGSFLKPEQVDGYLNATNPGDRRDVLGRFAFSVRSVDDAVESAAKGTRAWRKVGLMERAAAVQRFRDQLAEQAEPIAQLLVRESGKPLWEARQEVAASLRAVDLFLDDGIGIVAPRVMEDIAGRSDYVPRGVVALIGPAVMPLYNAVGSTVAAVLGGNGVVFKPSKYSPVAGQVLAELWDRTKMPRGVFNLIQGPGSAVGQRLVNHAGIDALLFTGSYETARELRRALVERPELPAMFQTGGKALAYVHEDAPRERTVYELLVGAFLTAGQRSNSTARVFVHTKAWDDVVPDLVRRAQRLRVGYGLDDDVFMGPLISDTLRTRFRKYCRALVSKGHVPLCEGDAIELSGHRGHYAAPGIYEVRWRGGLPFLNEEPPGPLLLVYRVESIDEAVDLHNRAVYRPVTSVFTRVDGPALPELRDRLRTGALNVNRSTIGASLRLPTSPQGRSGMGLPGGMELMRHLTYPRAGIVETRAFDAAHLVPGVEWADDSTVGELGAIDLHAE
ncbi:N-succinylglutamate 5-semialdehyde dehydrogenase [Deltaproteobacteria bacterium]|nr:N-succinylglutamate 5-semialdehyde dehydrogenase [Deltaproteobacteria bacterium]